MGQLLTRVDLSEFKENFGNMANEFLYVDWDGSISSLLLKLPILFTIITAIYAIYLTKKYKKSMKRSVLKKHKKNRKIILLLMILSIIGIIYIIYTYNYKYLPEKIKWKKKLSTNNKALYLYYNIDKNVNLMQIFKNLFKNKL
jgi:hypothetical protein